MSNLANALYRERSETITLDLISNTSDDELDQLLVDFVEVKLINANSDESVQINSLLEPLKMLYVTWILEGQVNNGGFFQFYWNGYGYLEKDIVLALKYFNAPQHLELFKKAISVNKREKWITKIFRLFFSYSFVVKFSKLKLLDDKFFDLNELLSDLRSKKIRKYPEKFLSDLRNI